jgi:hypothetical protein
MPDTKITALTALTAADPANDMMPIVDVSDTTMAASGTTKRISINNILACSPSATLASATISGALGAAGLNVTGATIPANGVYLGSANNLSFSAASTLGMTLNSTGLGVGVSPAVNLDIASASTTQFRIQRSGQADVRVISDTGVGILGTYSNHTLQIRTNGTAAIICDTAQNVGVGVTPSAWATLRGLQNGRANLVGYVSNAEGAWLSNNAFYDGSWKYQVSSQASYYQQLSGAHSWHIAASGTAGNAITFTQAMTLDASGNLLVGATSALASGSTFQNLGINRQVLTLKGDTAVSYTSGIWNASTTGDALFQYFATETSLTVRGGISYNRAGGLVAYNTTSDYRAKDIIGPVSNSGSLIDSLKVYVGKMKGATITRPMLIAHEAQEVAPYAVTGVKDEVDADGKDKYQQMDVSSFVPLLIAEIQSLRTRVQTLEAR